MINNVRKNKLMVLGSNNITSEDINGFDSIMKGIVENGKLNIGTIISYQNSVVGEHLQCGISEMVNIWVEKINMSRNIQEKRRSVIEGIRRIELTKTYTRVKDVLEEGVDRLMVQGFNFSDVFNPSTEIFMKYNKSGQIPDIWLNSDPSYKAILNYFKKENIQFVVAFPNKDGVLGDQTAFLVKCALASNVFVYNMCDCVKKTYECFNDRLKESESRRQQVKKNHVDESVFEIIGDKFLDVLECNRAYVDTALSTVLDKVIGGQENAPAVRKRLTKK